MSLCPSNLIAAQNNPSHTVFPNLARHKEDIESWPAVDAQVRKELTEAGIKTIGPHEFLRTNREVPAAYMGTHCLWVFRRAWYYWVATGPGVPADKAEEFHKTWGTQVRVDGHGDCPSPLEWHRGFAVSQYHIDTQEGLNAFARLLESIYIPRSGE